MPHQPTSSQPFDTLSWDDIATWAGSKIADRGRSYQREGRVEDLAVTETGSLIASVLGSEQYEVQVRMDEEGILDSHCTCPYGFDCKHGVATVLEYLTCIDQGKQIPMADPQDERLAWTSISAIDEVEDQEDDDEVYGKDLSRKTLIQVENLLNTKTKAEIVKMILGFVETNQGIASALLDMVQLRDGDVASLRARLSREIREVSSEPAWQNHWDDEGHIPDYSGIHDRLEALLAAGHADEVLALGKELIDRGISQIEMSHDDGETAAEVSDCIGVLPQALEASSLAEAERIMWALDLVIDDPFNLCDDLVNYLRQEHPVSAWNAVADSLLKRLGTGSFRKGDLSRDYQRDHLADWTIHALEQAGRNEEVIPLCETEAQKNDSYVRLVNRLIALERFEDAERWIRKGIAATKDEYLGVASQLRDMLLTIRTRRQDWSSVAILQIEEFVRRPSVRAFENCKDATDRLGAWPKIRHTLLEHLASGMLPWNHPEWSLQAPGKDAPQTQRHFTFPKFSTLIEISIQEKKPEEVLRWYDSYHSKHMSRQGLLDETVATAIATHAPDRAVAIWKNLAEQEIARVKPSAYHEAAGYLRKAAKVMIREKREAEWTQYLTGLRKDHFRKKRLLEILDTLSAEPIVRRKR